MVNSSSQSVLIGENLSHNPLIGLRQYTASTVIDRRKRDIAIAGIDQKSPIPIVPVEISQKRIHHEYVPEMVKQSFRGNKLLLFNGLQNV